MSRSYRKATAAKLQEIINTSTDPMVVIQAANTLAKFVPKPKSPRRRSGTPVAPIKAKEPDINELVAATEKKRKGQTLNSGSVTTESAGGTSPSA